MKKRNIMKTLFAGTMTLGMALSISPAFAQDVQTGTESNPAELWLAKELNIADGVSWDGQSFTFDFNQTGFNGAIPTTNYTVNLDTTLTVSSSDTVDSKNVLAGKSFPAAGMYTYTVTETGDDDLDEDGYGLTLSDAQYTVDVYVKNGTNGTYVYSVTVDKEMNDAGENTGTDLGKVDPNPGDGQEDSSGFRFVNTYTTQAGTEDDYGYLGLSLSKTVVGEYGDRTKDFTFTLNLTAPSTESNTSKTFEAYVVNGTQTTKLDNNLGYGDNTVYLSHGETIKVYGLPAGTKYTLTETEETDYTASYVIDSGTSTSSNQTNQVTIGNAASTVAFTNTYDDNSVTPTGIIINNLPFVLMVVIAGSGLALYVVSKRRAH